MKRIVLYVLLSSVLVGCKKNKIEVEENVVFETNASAAIINTASTFDLKVTIKSKIPSQGLKIAVTSIEEASGIAVVQPAPITIFTSTGNITLQNLPRQKWVSVTVNVSSIRTISNAASQTFKIIYK